MQGTGMLGSQMRPSGIGAHQQRPVQSSLRPPPPSAPNNQPAGSQVSANVMTLLVVCFLSLLHFFYAWPS